MYSIFFQIASLFYIILLILAYFSKKRINNIENKIYACLIINVFISLLFDIASIFTIKNLAAIPIINDIVAKMYLATLISWITFFTIYIIVLAKHDDNNDSYNLSYYKKSVHIFSIFYLIYLATLFILPLNYNFSQNAVYSYGPAANVSYLYAGILILIELCFTFFNIKKIPIKKLLPMFLFFIFGTSAVIIQMNNPSILLISFMDTFITFLMYFTIENPDMKLIEELNLAKEQAEKANRAKTDFLSNMSHEIRTPLNAIVGFSQALAEEDISSEAREEVKDIIMSSNNLLEIVNGILDISKIEANKLEIVNTEYDARKLMKDVVSLTKARLASRPLDFKVDIDPTMPQVLYGDHVRIKQILINILTNAVKYTKEGYIAFSVNTVITDDVCRLIMTVEDSGIGIKPEDIDKLFTKFQRFELEKNATTEGTGLGLAITKSLVELMNGKIVVQSKYGEGSKFTVSIDQRIIPKTSDEIETTDDTNTNPFNASGQRILVVDDNNINLKVANRLLKDYEADVVLINSGQECINRILDGEHYDLILMDDMMPHMTGTETLKNLKNIFGFKIPVVALTANAISGMRERYLSLGFDDYLAKPINQNHLFKVLKKYLVENTNPVLRKEVKNDIVQEEHNHSREFLESKGIDVNHGLELLGDMEMYDMTIAEFYKEFPEKMKKIDEYKNSNDMPNYAILVHAMKSDSKYLGFMELADISYKHEMASKEENISFVNENYELLKTEAIKIYNIVKEYIGE